MSQYQPCIVHESHHVLAVAKPFGMPSQRDQSGDPSLIDWAKDHLGREPHLIHRLDRPTGGLVLFGKTRRGTQEVSQQFAQREIRKHYLAVTSGQPTFSELELSHFIGKLPGKNFVRAYDKPVRHSKEARLKARVAQTVDGLTLLEIEPFTGRRHQIRAQLLTVKLSILGDLKYGKAKTPLEYPGIALWAYQIEFTDPETGPLILRAEPPDLFPWNGFKRPFLCESDGIPTPDRETPK
jgi:23S rRNA pseudouridine1911/1915/1917 synthase